MRLYESKTEQFNREARAYARGVDPALIPAQTFPAKGIVKTQPRLGTIDQKWRRVADQRVKLAKAWQKATGLNYTPPA